MRKLISSIFLLFFISFCVLCESEEVVIQAYKVGENNSTSYYYATIFDPEANDLLTKKSSKIDVSARGASGDGIVAFSWVFYGNTIGNTTISFTISPLSMTKNNNSYYLPFTMTFVCGESRVSHFTVPYNSTNTVSNASFSLILNNTTYTYEYSDYITSFKYGSSTIEPATLNDAKGSLSWSVNPTAGTHTDSQKVSITYNMGLKSKVKVNGVVIDSSYPSLCNQWNRAGTAYVKIDTNSDASYVSGNRTITPEPGTYTSNVTVEYTAE